MKRFLAILLILCFSSVAAVHGEEASFLPEEVNIEIESTEIAEFVSEESAAESVADLQESDNALEVELSGQDRIYYEKNVFELNFPSTASGEMLNSPNHDIMLTWFPEGYNGRISIINKNESLCYGAADAPGREGDLALRVYSPNTLTSNVTNNYIEPYLAGNNPQYTGANDSASWALMSTGDNGYVEFSFDFYTDGKTNTDIRIGRYICADDTGALSQVNDQTFWSVATDGTMKFRGKTIGTFSTSEINNKWHTMKFELTSDNRCKVYMDGTALTDYMDVTYQEKYFRGISHFRLYNMAQKGVSSEKFYDNFKYTAYQDITDIYELPEVSFEGLSSDTVTIEEREEYTVKVVADSVCPKEINIYVDGELVDTVPGRSAEYVYTGVLGTHELEAEAVDITGAVSEKEKIIFNVTERITIFGEFDGGASSDSYTDSDTRSVVFDATCEEGFEKTEIYVNGKLAGTYYDEIIDFDFSSFGTGTIEITAVVYDAEGKSKAFDYTADVLMSRLTVIWNEDYEKYTTGTTSLSSGNVQIVHKNGYSKAVTTDESHGTSMALGIEQDLGSDSGEYVNFVNPRPNSHVVFETDFYVSDYPADDAHIRVCMIESGSVQNNNIIRLGSNIYRTGAEMEYSTGTWYKLCIDFNMPEGTYSIYINGEPYITDVEFRKEKSNFTNLNYIRIYGPAKDGVPCYIAFDNTSLSVYESYSVDSVTGVDSEEICGGDNSFNITLSEQVNPDSLLAERITVSNGDITWRVADTSYNQESNTITVFLKDRLIGGREYRLELSGEIETSSGTMLGDKLLSGFFAESEASVGLVSSEFGGDSLTIELDAAKEGTAYVVYSAWNGDTFRGSAVKSADLTAGTNEISLPVPFAKSGDTVQLCIVESLANFKLLTDDIITVTK
ncbi:MAG: hypothetical protein IJ460_07880 [Clostridia bacterium]|nr:hypothetical protein [Clostridia bacterium]